MTMRVEKSTVEQVRGRVCVWTGRPSDESHPSKFHNNVLMIVWMPVNVLVCVA